LACAATARRTIHFRDSNKIHNATSHSSGAIVSQGERLAFAAIGLNQVVVKGKKS
jgi:hypothetical protein